MLHEEIGRVRIEHLGLLEFLRRMIEVALIEGDDAGHPVSECVIGIECQSQAGMLARIHQKTRVIAAKQEPLEIERLGDARMGRGKPPVLADRLSKSLAGSPQARKVAILQPAMTFEIVQISSAAAILPQVQEHVGLKA